MRRPPRSRGPTSGRTSAWASCQPVGAASASAAIFGYFRDLVGTSEGNTTNIDFGSFHFWRASITLLFRF